VRLSLASTPKQTNANFQLACSWPDDKFDVLGGEDAPPAELLTGLHAPMLAAESWQSIGDPLLNCSQIPQLLDLVGWLQLHHQAGQLRVVLVLENSLHLRSKLVVVLGPGSISKLLSALGICPYKRNVKRNFISQSVTSVLFLDYIRALRLWA
jgi:hypothetical protein